MKIRVIVICFIVQILLTNLINPPILARADSEYAMIATSDTEFFSDASCKMLKFCLPKGYYVKIVSIGSDYSRVIYMDGQRNLPSTEGYVANVNLIFTLSPESNPYPNINLALKNEEVLFSDTALNHPKTVVSPSSQVSYYGSVVLNGERFLYVYSSGHIGYVRSSAFIDYEIPVHPDYIKYEQMQNEQNEQSTSKLTDEKPTNQTSYGSLKIVVIAVIAVAGLCLMYLAIKPERRTKTEHSYFDDNGDF